MRPSSSQLQWPWPEWLEGMASLPPNPDGHDRLPFPDPLDWALHGLPSDPDHAQGLHITRALGGLGRTPTLFARTSPAPAWDPDAFLKSSRAPDFTTLSSDQRLEIALLVSVCRGADPWSWGGAPAGQVPLKPLRMLGELFSRRLLVAAAAMLAHPSCPPHVGARESLIKVVGPWVSSRSLSLGAGLALANDVQAMGVLIRQAGPSLNMGSSSPLEYARSVEMAQLLLQSEAIQAREVFHALAFWLSPDDRGQGAPPSVPSSVRNDLVCEAKAWWYKKGLGDEGQWDAQVACLKAIVHKPGSGAAYTPVGVFDAWLRKVGAFRGNLWLPGLAQDGQCRPGEPHGLRPVPSSTVRAWLADRSHARVLWDWEPGERPGGQPWYWQGRIERLEAWKELERGLGPAGDVETWEKAWGRFWSWVPHLGKWSEEDARHAARLWKMEHRPCHWPPPGWSLEEMGPDFLGGIAPQVRQIAGEAFVLSMVDGTGIREQAPGLAQGVDQKKWWGPQAQDRMQWIKAWLETPGWHVPPLTQEQEVVLNSWPAGEGELSREGLVSMWQSRVMEESLSRPSPSARMRGRL